jgi:hypothetical protein
MVDDAARQVSYLTSSTGRSVSCVMREAIAADHAPLKGQRAMPLRLLPLLAEHLGRGNIHSTDVRAFGANRWKNRKPFKNLLETA